MKYIQTTFYTSPIAYRGRLSRTLASQLLNGSLRPLAYNDPVSYFNEMSTECMESLPAEKRFFQNNYAPIGGRMYITDSNALRIDFARNTIEDWNHAGFLSPDEYYYLVACVVEGVPFVSNIAGTYGAFNKTWDIRSNKLFVLIDLPVY
jgi:adenine-specific DNA-methyltransferase